MLSYKLEFSSCGIVPGFGNLNPVTFNLKFCNVYPGKTAFLVSCSQSAGGGKKGLVQTAYQTLFPRPHIKLMFYHLKTRGYVS